MRVKARVSKTNRFREVTLRRAPEMNDNTALYEKTPSYTHVNRKTVSGVAYETGVEKWVFIPYLDTSQRRNRAKKLYS